jgi:hypothetical protein
MINPLIKNLLLLELGYSAVEILDWVEKLMIINSISGPSGSILISPSGKLFIRNQNGNITKI